MIILATYTTCTPDVWILRPVVFKAIAKYYAIEVTSIDDLTPSVPAFIIEHVYSQNCKV